MMEATGSGQRVRPSHVLAAAALAAAPLALVSGLAMAPLFVVAVAGVLATGWRQRPWTAFPHGLAVAMAAIVVWAGLSAAWAIHPGQSLYAAFILALQTAGGAVLVGAARTLDEGGRRRVARGLVVGLGLALAYVAVDFAGDMVLTRMIHHLGASGDVTPWFVATRVSRGITVDVLLLWAGCLGLVRLGAPRRSWLLLVAAVAVAVFALHTLAAKIAVVAGLALLLAGRRVVGAAGKVLPALAFVTVMMAPVAAHYIPPPQESADLHLVPPVLHHRLTIWRFVGERILDKPLAGWGIEASRDIPGGEDRVDVVFAAGGPSDEQMLPLHPHNAVLQWWLELGGIGAVLFAVLAARLFRAAAALPPALAAAALATLLDGFVSSLVSYGFWQAWWQSSLWLTAMALIAVAGKADDPHFE